MRKWGPSIGLLSRVRESRARFAATSSILNSGEGPSYCVLSNPTSGHDVHVIGIDYNKTTNNEKVYNVLTGMEVCRTHCQIVLGVCVLARRCDVAWLCLCVALCGVSVAVCRLGSSLCRDALRGPEFVTRCFGGSETPRSPRGC